jgi:hypothetical protein
MNAYNPMQQLPPKDWLELSQSGRQERITNYLEAHGERPDNLIRLAFSILAVENQLALGNQSVTDTLARLMASGMNRLTALQKIGNLYWKYETEKLRPHPDTIDFESYEFDLNAL